MVTGPVFELFDYNIADKPPTSESFCYPLNRTPVYESCAGIDDVNVICDLLAEAKGPFAFVYHRPDLQHVFVGRDRFGRCSLVASRTKSGNKMVFSKYASFEEPEMLRMSIPAGSMYIIDYQKGGFDFITFIAYERLQNKEPLIRKFQAYRYMAEGAIVMPKINDEEVIVSAAELDAYAVEGISKFDDAMLTVTSDVKDDNQAVGILFSGGVDSLLVAIFAHRCLPKDRQIDLINVAFGNSEKSPPRTAPDRPHSIDAYEYLCKKYPSRNFKMVLVDVMKEEVASERVSSYGKYINPQVTVLDDSIGTVLYFASRAQGTLYETADNFTSDCRILLVGSGADELFGGYSRHRGRFEDRGRSGLIQELNDEIENIGDRNLGRDDRVISSNKREVRIPFLEDEFAAWAMNLPLDAKVNFDLPRGRGEKIVIREMLKRLGVEEKLYSAPKKAMQFGTKIAKLEAVKEKGGDACNRLTG